MKNDVVEKIFKLKYYIEKNEYKGWDPYDALTSPIIKGLCFNTKYGRIAWTQFMRRAPLNFRKILFTPKGINPKAIGLFIAGYTELYKIFNDQAYIECINNLLDILEEYRSKGYNGNSWGYNFDWQSKAAFVPKYTPTIVNTSFIGHSLLDVYETLKIERALKLAIPIRDFITSNLNRKEENNTYCFSYTPLDKNYVHNANLLGASILFRLSQITNDISLKKTALSSLHYTLNYQHNDGSWFYAERKMQNWIDSFHTGFNLLAIRFFLKENNSEILESYEKGIAFYANNFFLSDGTPKYYNDRTYPIDIHSPLVGIIFFSDEYRYKDLVKLIAEWTFQNLWSKNKGCFYFRKNKYYTIRIPYIRWSQAWGFYALAKLLNTK